MGLDSLSRHRARLLGNYHSLRVSKLEKRPPLPMRARYSKNANRPNSNHRPANGRQGSWSEKKMKETVPQAR